MLKLKKMNRKSLLRVIPAALFIFFVFLYACLNVPRLGRSFRKIGFTGENFGKLTTDLEGAVCENFNGKRNFINLNGITVSLLGAQNGLNSLNGRQKMPNGHLAGIGDTVDADSLAAQRGKSVLDLCRHLEDRKIPFLYLAAPEKLSFYNAEPAPGYSLGNMREVRVKFLDILKGNGIDFIDMDGWFEKNGWTMDDVFFRTDHHWRPEAAFVATRLALEFLNEKWGIVYDKNLCDLSNWNVKIYKDWFLGTHGKRVSKYYAGVDDISLITPKNIEQISLSWHSEGKTIWGYRTGPIAYERINKKDYFGLNPHAAYLGGSYPIAMTRNPSAPNKGKILTVGDSFSHPVTVFLSAQFAQVCSIDLRQATDSTIAEYIDEFHPDVVLACHNDGALGGDVMYDFGLDEYKAGIAKTKKGAPVRSLGDFSLSGEKNKLLCENLKSDTYYTLSVDSVSLQNSDAKPAEYVQFELQNLASNEPVSNHYFSKHDTTPQRWIFKTPVDENGNFSIFAYAGTKGDTTNKKVSVTGIALREGIFPVKSKSDISELLKEESAATEKTDAETSESDEHFIN